MNRPDAVYRTGVLMPMVGYQPGQNVQMVAQAFTNAGPSLQLSGPPLNWWQRMKYRIAARRSARQTQKMLRQLVQQPITPTTPTLTGLHGPYQGVDGMARMAARISAGQTPLPAGARSYLQAGTAVNSAANVPLLLAREAVAGAPSLIEQRASALGIRNFLQPRRGRFDAR